MSDKMMKVIVTAGPTNERIDAVMQITNMSTGALGARIVEAMLDADGNHPGTAGRIGKIYYLANKLARKPVVPDGQSYKLEWVKIGDAQDLLEKLSGILKSEEIGLVVHSAAVGDYKARYSARGEDLAEEIAKSILNMNYGADKAAGKRALSDAVLKVLENPACRADDETKMSSYEPNLLTMMDLTPKVIGCVKDISPRTMLIGFKLLDNVSDQELFAVASRLRQKNKADYIVANDLARIGNGAHPAMVVGEDAIMGRDAIVAECGTKQDIADTICRLAFPDADAKYVMGSGKKTVWQVIAANNMNTDVRVEGTSYEREEAWDVMLDKFAESMSELLPAIRFDKGRIKNSGHWEFDDEHARAAISSDSASVYDGEDMWYYNLVPVAEAPAEPEAPWLVSGPGAPDQAYAGIDDAWMAMWIAFKKALSSATGWYDYIPDSQDILDARTWGIVKDGIRASVGPMSAELYDGSECRSWRLERGGVRDHMGRAYPDAGSARKAYGAEKA